MLIPPPIPVAIAAIVSVFMRLLLSLSRKLRLIKGCPKVKPTFKTPLLNY
jgi:hypothetical protein